MSGTHTFMPHSHGTFHLHRISKHFWVLYFGTSVTTYCSRATLAAAAATVCQHTSKCNGLVQRKSFSVTSSRSTPCSIRKAAKWTDLPFSLFKIQQHSDFSPPKCGLALEVSKCPFSHRSFNILRVERTFFEDVTSSSMSFQMLHQSIGWRLSWRKTCSLLSHQHTYCSTWCSLEATHLKYWPGETLLSFRDLPK